jgi:predicted RNA polymerase sigma factor
VGSHRLAADHRPLRRADPDLAIPRGGPQPRHAIATGEAHGPQAGLAALDQRATEPQLASYHYLPAARAEFLRRLHRTDDARLAYHEARLLTGNPIERDFLTRRLDELDR